MSRQLTMGIIKLHVSGTYVNTRARMKKMTRAGLQRRETSCNQQLETIFQ